MSQEELERRVSFYLFSRFSVFFLKGRKRISADLIETLNCRLKKINFANGKRRRKITYFRFIFLKERY